MRVRTLSVVLLVLLVVVLGGCTVLGPTARLLAGPAQAAVDTLAGNRAAGTAAAGNGANAGTPVPVNLQARTQVGTTIAIPAGADVETAIYEAVYQKVNPSVVYIENLTNVSNQGNFGGGSNVIVPESSGSGFVWDDQGRIVTNNHVVSGADKLEVTFSDGIVLPAEVVATDPDSDLAVIKVDPRLVKLTPVEQGNIEDVKVGSRAIAIGNPFGMVGTMTTGIVSAIGRSLASNPDAASSFSIPQVIQTDAAMNPGNSGGPLVNEQGQVIGVNFQIRSDSGTSSGVGFSIPINIVQRVAPALIKSGRYEHAYMGIRGQTYTPAWAEALGFSTDVRGAYVMDIAQGGPADSAGLRAASQDTDFVLGVSQQGPVYLQSGGDLITAIDGQPVKTFDDLLVYLENYKSPGDQITLTELRSGGRQGTVTLTLAARPSQAQ
jgi:serine protease Do